MQRTHAIGVLAALCLGTSIHAQTPNANTAFTASRILSGGTPVTGTLTIKAVDQNGLASSLSSADGFFYGQDANGNIFVVPVTAGALPSGFTVPDQSTAAFTRTAANRYLVDVYGVPASAITQATRPLFEVTLPANTVTGSTFAFDKYAPVQVAAVLPPGLISAPYPPLTCIAPSLFYPTSADANGNYKMGKCVGNSFKFDSSTGGPGGTGTPGANGSNFLQSNGVPASSYGNNGDSALDYTTGNLYAKSGGAWSQTGNLKGSQGTPGTSGAPGTPGTPGTPGANGQGFNFRGAWATSTAYNPYDVVTYGGSTYTPIAAFTSGSSFNALNWYLVAAQGQAGTPGAAGAGINPDGTKNGALNLTSTGTQPTAPSSNTIQMTVPSSGVTAYAWSMPPTAPPDATHTMLSFALNNGVWQAAWVTASGVASVSQIDYWPMSDTGGTDSVGSNTLTYTGATATTDSTLGNVLTFSGSGGSGGLSSSNTLTNFTNTSAFSLAAWVKPTTVTGSTGTQEIFASIPNTAPYTGYTMNVTNQAVSVQLISNLNNGNIMTCTSSSNVFTSGTLTHVAMTYDGSQTAAGVTLYVNGASVARNCSGTLSGSFATGGKLGIGKTVDGANVFTGVIARAHVDTGVDSAATIQNYYSGKN